MTDRFDAVSVLKQANVYFDGQCVSHTVLFADGTRKSLGVIFPSTLTFSTGSTERNPRRALPGAFGGRQ